MRMLFATIALLWAVSASASSIVGSWAGAAVRGGETRALRVTIVEDAAGLRATYDLPALGLEGIPVSNLRLDPETGAYSAGHQMSLSPKGERLTGTMSPLWLHGSPVEVVLTRADAPAANTKERAVEFVSRGLTLRGTLVAPRSPGPYPAIVSLHGSGPSTRWVALGRARKFADAGYVTLIFDKPGSGDSEGDWTKMSLDDAAADALAAMAFLRGQPEVNSEQVGLWGHSQAGWVISRAAAMTDDIAFALVLAGGGNRPEEVERYGYRNRLAHSGASEADIAKAMALVDDYMDYLRTGAGYDRLMAAAKQASNEAWGRALGLSRVIPTPEYQPKWAWVANYDPIEDIRKIRSPVFIMFAGRDRSSPVEGLSIWRRNLSAGGNTKFETHVVAGADHHFLITQEDGGWPDLAPTYFGVQLDWLARTLGSKR